MKYKILLAFFVICFVFSTFAVTPVNAFSLPDFLNALRSRGQVLSQSTTNIDEASGQTEVQNDFTQRQRKLKEEFDKKNRELRDELKIKQDEGRTQLQTEMKISVCQMQMKRKQMMSDMAKKFDNRLDEIVSKVGTNASKVENYDSLLADAKAKRETLRALYAKLTDFSVTCGANGQPVNQTNGEVFGNLAKAMRDYHQSVAKFAAAIRKAHLFDKSKAENQNRQTGASCGGIAGLQCATGYVCRMTATYPDAMGKCVKATTKPGPSVTIMPQN